MTRKKINYTLENAIAWAADMREAMDAGEELPMTYRLPNFVCRKSRPDAFEHWCEYAKRAMQYGNAKQHWKEQFQLYRSLDTLEDEYTCLVSVLRCVQRESDGEIGTMHRMHFLAAEIFGYSFANYRDHLGIGNIRYEDLMPDDANRLVQAVRENWPLAKVAKDQETDTDIAASLILSTKQAVDVLDAGSPAKSFRVAVRQLLQKASEQGLNTDQEVESLLTQICYRVSDLSCLLDEQGETLEQYSQELRETSNDVDDETLDE